MQLSHNVEAAIIPKELNRRQQNSQLLWLDREGVGLQSRPAESPRALFESLRRAIFVPDWAGGSGQALFESLRRTIFTPDWNCLWPVAAATFKVTSVECGGPC